MDSLITGDQFWCGISILLTNYHALNRKIFACVIRNIEGFSKINGIQTHCANAYTKDQLQLYLMKYGNEYKQTIDEPDSFIIYFKLLSKKAEAFIEATGHIDIKNFSYTLKFQTNNLDDFSVQLKQKRLLITALTNEVCNNIKTINWLQYVFKPKFVKWCLSYDVNKSSPNKKNMIKGSLSIIDAEKYNELYKLLKCKYGKPLLKLWKDSKQSTDPLKFIYEDLAIAAYLIILWQSDMIKTVPTIFADLGCGNGLLVYILNKEGYLGYGYDLRKRKIWYLYPEHITNKLYEQTIQPENLILENNVNWLIGNHSDELSPWLPVLAATHHYNTCYFLLPCCAFEFSGKKFQRKDSSLSVYNDFCNYIENVSNECGYKTLKDRLKIPSTKRIAFIGINRNYTLHDFPIKRKEIERYVIKEQQSVNPDGSFNIPIDRLQLRTQQEVVKNCTQIDKKLLNVLLKKIFTLLLNANKNSNSVNCEESWCIGGSLPLKDIVQFLQNEDLKIIKSECGGLKTLLRNHHEIFVITPNDVIRIRKPEIKVKLNQQQPLRAVKKRRCFFYDNHPQGCPLSNEACTFIH